MKLLDILQNKICANSGHYHFSIDILVLLTTQLRKNDLIGPKSVYPNGFLMEIELDSSMLSS